jgi:gliding motility-associated-like protein
VNEPPVANDLYTATPINTPIGVNVATSNTDPNGDPLTYSYPGGTVTPNGTWTPTGNGAGVYTPKNGFTGVDSFKYVVCDNSPYPVNVLCDTAWVYITVTDPANDTVNNAPIANNDYGVTDDITTVVIPVRANDIDPDGDQLTLPTVISPSVYGATVTVNPDGTVSYDPSTGTYPANINVDSFRYVICDTNAANLPRPLCDTAWVYVIVNTIDTNTISPNRPPLATDDFDSTTYGMPEVVTVLNNDSDPDGDSIYTTVVVIQPEDGTATVNPDGTITYTPDFGPGVGPNANNPDTFTYVICDNGNPVLCDTATVVIYVPNSVQATNDNTLTGVGVPVVIDVMNNDWDPETDSFFVTTILGNGGTGTNNVPTLWGNATINPDGTITYTPNGNNCNVTDTFRYIIQDTLGAVDTATVYVFVDCCVNPVAVDDIFTVQRDDTLFAAVIANDVYSTQYPQYVNIISRPGYGTAYVVNDTIVYVPRQGYCGNDYIEYTIRDTCGIDTANININVQCYNNPIAVTDTASLCLALGENTVTVNVLANDTHPGGLPINVVVYTQPNHGTASGSNGVITYTVDGSGYLGNDTIAYAICDNGTPRFCADGFFIISIDSCMNYPPIVVGPILDTTPVNTPDTVCIGGLVSDPNSDDSLSITSICPPANGTAAIISPLCFVYTPDTNFVGNDTFCIVVCDNGNPVRCDTSSVIITVFPILPDQFVDANPDVVFTPGGTPVVINVMVNDTLGPQPGDVFTGDSIFVTNVTNGSNGTVVINLNGTVTYTPDSGFCGVDTFTYIISDNGQPAQLDTTYVVIYVCDTPRIVAVDDTTSVPRDGTITIGVLNNDILTNATNVTVTVSTDPTQGGTISVNPDGTISYTAQTGYCGNDTFTYVVCGDVAGINLCDTATVVVRVVCEDPCFFSNAFSPNGDGEFDNFQLPCADKYPRSVLKVYNRWGDEVWRSGEGYKNDWDGKNLSGTDLPDGTYYYIFNYNDGNKKSEAKFVVIQR